MKHTIMSKDESLLSNVSIAGSSGGTQAHLVKVLANVVEAQKNVASQFTALFDRVEEARNETRRNVAALTEEIKKLEIRSSAIFEKVTMQLIAQNDALTAAHAAERAHWSAQNEAMSATHAAERAHWNAQNNNMLSLIKATMGNTARPTPVVSQPMQTYNQAMSANAMFGGAPTHEQQVVDQLNQLTPNQIGALQLQMRQMQFHHHQQQQQTMLGSKPAASSTAIATPAAVAALLQPVAPKMEVNPVVPIPAPLKPKTEDPVMPTLAPSKPKVEEPVMPPPAPKPKVEEPKKIVPAVPAPTVPVAPTTAAPSKPKAVEPKKSTPAGPAAASTAWGDKFKMSAEERECAGCYVRYAANLAECSCCGAPNPEYVEKEGDKPSNPFGKNVSVFNPADASSSSGPKFSFGLGGGTTTSSSTTTTTIVASKSETKTATPSTPLFSFSSGVSTAPTTTTTTTAAPKFSFMQAAVAANKEDDKKPQFGSPAPSVTSNAFGAGVTSSSSTASTFSFKAAPSATASPLPAFSFKTPDPSKPSSIFGGSQKTLFGTSNPSTPVDAKKEDDKKDTPSSIFGTKTDGQPTANLGFSALSGKPSIFEQQDKVAEGQKNFASLAKSKPFGQSGPVANEEDGEEGEPEEYEPDVDFTPVIPLPDLVEVKTGEEDEKVLFTARSKIFRYVRETKEYKERGVGELKLLHNEATNKFRVLMRRDQVHKLCANFAVTKTSNLVEKTGQPNVRAIVVTDFAENEAGEMESLCIKFKNADVAKEFENFFHDSQARMQ
ncbi:hypothetical protein PRIPAC_70053 [Pristionchus pacificus]|nr:hypothetical protein PRIPAC_70053 [Pristionchus pacificus]